MAGKPVARNKNGSGTKRSYYSTRKSGAELERASSIDDLALYDNLFAGALRGLKEDIAKGMDAISLAKKYAALAQARIVTTALTDEDSGKALAASQDIINRAHGKAVEKKEIKHAMADASDAELDAIIESKMREVGPSSTDNSNQYLSNDDEEDQE